MATRYWVGGDGTWDTTSTANWAATSGGIGGQPAPTIVDDVIFDSNSGSGIATCIGAVCANFTSALLGSGLGFNGSVTIYGNVVNNGSFPNTTLVGSGSHTITSNGFNCRAMTISSPGGTYTLADNFSASSFALTSGTFNTANYNFSSTIIVSGTDVCAMSLGSSTVTTSSLSFSVGNNFTFSAGTSTIQTSLTLTITTTNSDGTVRTFYNVSAPSLMQLFGLNTFNNVTVGDDLRVSGNVTINGALILDDGTLDRHEMAGSPGVRCTVTVNSLPVTPVYWDFSDIELAGAVAPLSGAYLGDRGNNSGITFPPPKTVYWVGGSAFWNSNTAWALTSGGTPSAANIALAQDSVIVDNNSGVPCTIRTLPQWWCTSFDASARTSGASLNVVDGFSVQGNLTLGSSFSVSGAGGYINFAGRAPQTITPNGVLFGSNVLISSINSTVNLAGALTINTNSVFINGALWFRSGTFNLNNYNLTVGGLAFPSIYISTGSTGPSPRGLPPPNTFALGSGVVSIANGFTNIRQSVVFTGLSTGKIQFTGSLPKTLASGSFGSIFPTIEQAGAGTLTITGSAQYYDLVNSYKSTGATTIRFAGDTVSTFNSFNLAGEAGRLCTLTSSTAPTRASLALTNGTPINAGSTSTDAGNNTGVLFTGAGNGYLSVSYINSLTGQNKFLLL